jgi:hypothetical protein
MPETLTTSGPVTAENPERAMQRAQGQEPGREATAPEGEEPVIVMDPVLMEALTSLDRDISGEQKFCRNALEALRAFQARWSTDNAVCDGYGQAMKALENMDSILTGAGIRTTENVTRSVLARKDAAQTKAKADVAREHAVAWAEQPVPQPEPADRDRQTQERQAQAERERQERERQERERQERERQERERQAQAERDRLAQHPAS